MTMLIWTTDRLKWHYFRNGQEILTSISILTVLWYFICWNETLFQSRNETITWKLLDESPKLLLSMIRIKWKSSTSVWQRKASTTFLGKLIRWRSPCKQQENDWQLIVQSFWKRMPALYFSHNLKTSWDVKCYSCWKHGGREVFFLYNSSGVT